MCRLYGFRATEPTKVECTLIHAQNAMLSQSRGDARGLAHADGWGIAAWSDNSLEIERHERAAFEDLHFTVTAERVYATSVIAHIRLATMGVPSKVNTHPFRYGRWAFAHNGTVTGFKTLEPGLAAETASDLRDTRQGTTDSETAFLWLLTRFVEAGVDLDAGIRDQEATLNALAQATVELDARCRTAAPDKTPRLNFLFSDGEVLIASRWNHTLHLTSRDGIRDCEVCGIPHVDHTAGSRYRAVVIASEPISHEQWMPVPEGHLLSVGPECLPSIRPITALASS